MVSDVLVVGSIVVFILAGYKMGFVKAIFRIFSKVLSLVMAVKFYGPVTDIIKGSTFFSELLSEIRGRIKFILGDGNVIDDDVAGSIMDNMHVPNTIKVSVLKDLPYNINVMDKSDIIDVISSKIGTAVLQVLGMIAVFIVVRLVLFVARALLDKIFHLPVLNQVNKLAGLVFGAVEGVIAVYIAMSIVVIVNSDKLISNIDHSLIAKYFYYNNILLAMM